jgi:hypothetical protein
MLMNSTLCVSPKPNMVSSTLALRHVQGDPERLADSGCDKPEKVLAVKFCETIGLATVLPLGGTSHQVF